MRAAVLTFGLAAAAACGGGSDAPPDGPGRADAPPTLDAPGDAPSGPLAGRPYLSKAPYDLVPGRRLPLVLLLHGQGITGQAQALYLGLDRAVNRLQIFLAYPDGTPDADGVRFWNATDACCAEGADVDDVAYLTAVLDDMERRYEVDPDRIYVIGHSNGGFMAHRLACELSPRIAAIASLAGATWADPARCVTTDPVNVLELHGDDDDAVPYDGGLGDGGAPYPGAEATIDTWATKNGCTGALAVAGEPFGLDADVAGAETTPLTRAPCPAGGHVTLWRMHGSTHVPNVVATFPDAVMPWLLAHPKP